MTERSSPATETLLPCPFCGQAPVVCNIKPHSHKGGIASFMPDHPGSSYVECGCGAGLIDATEELVRARWNRRSADRAATAPEVRCYGCGSAWTDEQLIEARKRDPKIISCCPERKPLDITAWMAMAVAAEQRLLNVAQPSTTPGNSREILEVHNVTYRTQPRPAK